MKIINRFNAVSVAVISEKKRGEMRTQIGQAYEVRDLVERYVQGNPPDVAIHGAYVGGADIDAPPLRHPFGGDLIDMAEDIAERTEYANESLRKDATKNARAPRARKNDASPQDDN